MDSSCDEGYDKNESDTCGGTTLEQLFQKHGPFPMEEHIVASILREVTSPLVFLHSRDVVHGNVDSSSVILDIEFNAKIIVSTSIHRVPPSKAGMKSKAEDVFRVGLLLYRMLTGHTAKFAKTGKLVGGPSPYMRVSEKGMKLVDYMLSKCIRFPPTMARVRYSDWLDECEENPPVFVLFPDDKS
ncbi:hypothetical protein KIN20_001355 [Parelaphostrongylus tenuis]|uniref:Protein kinase domain-containing protein n=1 Tax=Parelaphostrongylus tenuis TaxID=148309 RepID=A0AAD5QG67_PARTN|nr:hypothetical protein KIN20_001355 [Parelaphostrongylus tenuis]